MRVFFIVLLIVATLAACGGNDTPPGPIAGPAVTETWQLGGGATLQVQGDGESYTIFLMIDGVGPNGAAIRGITPLVNAGDPLVFQAGGKWFQAGTIFSINVEEQSVTVVMWESLMTVPTPKWAATD